MNKSVIIIVALLFVSVILKAQFSVNIGSNIGGAIPTTKTEGASAKILPGLYLGIAHDFTLTTKIKFQPAVVFDFKLFGYMAMQRKDTIVEAEVAGIIANIPTYYKANVNGNIRLAGAYLELPLYWTIFKKNSLVVGIYGSGNYYKSDEVNLNVQIGEGGLLPDFDSTYNNKSNINTLEAGVLLGGSFYINDKLSVSIIGYRALTRFYKFDAIKDDAGNDIPFYYTMVRIGISYSF